MMGMPGVADIAVASAARQSQRAAAAPVFYSELLRRVEAVRMMAATPGAWLDWIQGLPQRGVSSHEIEATCVRDWLELQAGKVLKATLLSYLREAIPEIGTVLLSEADGDEADPDFGGYPRHAIYQLPAGGGDTNHRELLLVLSDDWHSSKHWRDIPNVIVHVRLFEVTDDEGRAVLFVREVQSDWLQSLRQGRRVIHKSVRDGFDGMVKRIRRAGLLSIDLSGRFTYRGRTHDEHELRAVMRGMPLIEARPFVFQKINPVRELPLFDSTDKWVAIALRRVIRLAVDKGYSRVAVISGAMARDTMPGKAGAGLAAFYDRVVPVIAKGVLRKLGGQVRTVSIWGSPFTGFDITEAIGGKARAGLPLF